MKALLFTTSAIVSIFSFGCNQFSSDDLLPYPEPSYRGAAEKIDSSPRLSKDDVDCLIEELKSHKTGLLSDGKEEDFYGFVQCEVPYR